jgi:hypothetical protein
MGPAGSVNGAHNGVSMNGNNVVLGQDNGSTTGPAILLNDKFIPMMGNA